MLHHDSAAQATTDIVSQGTTGGRAVASRRPLGPGNLPRVDPALLADLHPTLYHMAEDGTWPSIRQRGLLSTQAIVDLYQPDDHLRKQILAAVRRDKITLTSPALGEMTIRDQRPAKFLQGCVNDGINPQDYLDALNGRVFFWLRRSRLARLLNARLYRNSKHTVLHVDTARLVGAYADRIQLAPYNTGSMHVPTAPRRGPDVFTNLADYPYEHWLARRGRSGEPVVELTIGYAIPDITKFVTRVETWAAGEPIAVLYPDSPTGSTAS